MLLDVLCLLGVLWSGTLIGLLLTGDRPFGTGLAVGVAALLVLPGFLAGIVSNRPTFRGRRPADGDAGTVWRPPVDLPVWALIAAGTLFLAFWVAGMTAFAGMDQDAVDAQQIGYEQRLGVGVLGGLGVGGTTLAAASVTRARQARY